MKKEVWRVKYDPETKLYAFRRHAVLIIADHYEVSPTSVDLYLNGALVGYISTTYNRIIWVNGREFK